jgi:hypothetical protein
VNGRVLLRALDLAGSYGRYVAVERMVVAEAVEGRGLTVGLAAIVGEPIIRGILLHRRSATRLPCFATREARS